MGKSKPSVSLVVKPKRFSVKGKVDICNVAIPDGGLVVRCPGREICIECWRCDEHCRCGEQA